MIKKASVLLSFSLLTACSTLPEKSVTPLKNLDINGINVLTDSIHKITGLTNEEILSKNEWQTTCTAGWEQRGLGGISSATSRYLNRYIDKNYKPFMPNKAQARLAVGLTPKNVETLYNNAMRSGLVDSNFVPYIPAFISCEMGDSRTHLGYKHKATSTNLFSYFKTSLRSTDIAKLSFKYDPESGAIYQFEIVPDEDELIYIARMTRKLRDKYEKLEDEGYGKLSTDLGYDRDGRTYWKEIRFKAYNGYNCDVDATWSQVKYSCYLDGALFSSMKDKSYTEKMEKLASVMLKLLEKDENNALYSRNKKSINL